MHTIHPYKISIFDKINGKGGYPSLGALDNGKVDAFNLIKNWISDCQKKNVINHKEKSLTVQFKNFKFDLASRRIYGWVYTGEYGTANTIVNVKDGSLAYAKKSTNAEMIPHFVYLVIPKTSSKGLVLLHSVRNSGVKTIFHELLNAYCASVLPDRRFQINPAPYKKALQLWRKALTKEIKAIPKVQSSDIADVVRKINPDSETVVIIKPPLRGNFGKWSDFDKKGTPQAELLEVLENDYENITATIQSNGKSRKIRMGTKITNEICIIEAPDDLELSDGNPKIQSILAWCEDIRQDFKY
ncbi:hypothetical protein RFY44_05760 [Acinetobacter bereziniae]|uniref:hypothetical protein n=1 Tax=Acinetobacter TaxID=469 RepID=UPI000449AA6D|nr:MULTISPECIES: hypothetical protein [Acinetobacter]EXC24851.1 hypothetical protein J536_3806 [Acinetobacter sp. 809848]MCM8510878.1 hypothetical protein [Acinetobacter bereziniae]MDQ9818386.1 hypothetical protein [Acinetobacter bereziniae]